MKSVRNAHIVVIADSDHSLVLAARLRRMDVAWVTAASDYAEARSLCRDGSADACIVVYDDAVLDAPPLAAKDAPGRGCGVPSLMVVHAVTPNARKIARRDGYLAAVSASIAPRMLYRRIGAALQQRRRARRARLRPPGGFSAPFTVPAAVFGKPTLH